MDHLSSSQINLYLLCSQKYKYTYIDGLPKPFRSSALAFGSAFHSALSWLHTQRMKKNPVSVEMLFKIFETDWFSQRVETDIHYKEGEEEMKLASMGKEMLGLYFKQPHTIIKGSEVPFTIPLVNPLTGEDHGINFEGFFDLVEADETIVEFKTSAQVIAQPEIEIHLQLTAYGFAYQILHGRPARGFKLVNFIKNKKPRLEVSTTTRDKSHYEAFFLIVGQVLKSIRSGIFFPRSGYWCRDCEYANICPLWKQKQTGVLAATETNQ